MVAYKFMQIHLVKVLAVSYNDTFAYLKAIDCIGKEGEGRIWRNIVMAFLLGISIYCTHYKYKKELQKFLCNKALVDPISVFNLSKKSPFLSKLVCT